ncbi:MAG: hypothetical protein M0026_17530 [Nocardiopsaceae bacterium]|nr:hypothetical protein [Nocardiopsaceae bacterium]
MPASHRTRPATTAITALALATATTAPANALPTGPDTADYPGHTTSSYVLLTDDTTDRASAYQSGCAHAESGRNGLRILFFGTQEDNGRLRHPGTTAAATGQRTAADQAVTVARGWAEGFTACRTDDTTARLALGVNNKSDGGLTGATAGKQWAAIVDEAADQADTTAVTITGAVDAEPGWSAPRWARAWVKAFTSATDRTLYAANSADGCPVHGSASTSCNNGWDLADLHYVATGAAPTIRAVPQIYRTDGIQARQWAAISSWGATHGNGPVRFAGSLSQHTACSQRGGCPTTDNTPEAAWTQLWNELNAHPETQISALPYATDMRWP